MYRKIAKNIAAALLLAILAACSSAGSQSAPAEVPEPAGQAADTASVAVTAVEDTTVKPLERILMKTGKVRRLHEKTKS